LSASKEEQIESQDQEKIKQDRLSRMATLEKSANKKQRSTSEINEIPLTINNNQPSTSKSVSPMKKHNITSKLLSGNTLSDSIGNDERKVLFIKQNQAELEKNKHKEVKIINVESAESNDSHLNILQDKSKPVTPRADTENKIDQSPKFVTPAQSPKVKVIRKPFQNCDNTPSTTKSKQKDSRPIFNRFLKPAIEIDSELKADKANMQIIKQEILNAKCLLEDLRNERQVLCEEIQELRAQRDKENEQRKQAEEKMTAQQKANRAKSADTTLIEQHPSRTYRPLTNLMRFDGEGDMNEFILEKRRIAKVYYWTEKEEKEIAIYHLDGEALKFAESLLNTLSLDKFYNKLKTKYQSDSINDNINFRNLTPEINESFRYFTQRLNKACKKAFKSLGEQDKVQTMLSKLVEVLPPRLATDVRGL
jgi:hypothetical protein